MKATPSRLTMGGSSGFETTGPSSAGGGSSSLNSFSDGKKGRFRRAFHTALLVIIKEDSGAIRSSRFLSIALLLIDFFQLLSFAIASELSPQLNLLKSVATFFSVFRLQLALSGSPTVYFILLFASWFWIALIFASLYYVFKTCRQGASVKYLFPFKFLRFSVGLCIAVLYVPINQILLFISDCDFSKMDHMYLDIKCFTTSHIIYLSISVFLLLIFTSFLLLMSLFAFEYKPGKSFSARVHGRLDFIYLLCKFLLGIVLRVCRQLEFSRIWAASLLLCSSVLFFCSLYYLPFYSRALNMIRTSCFSGFFWISICIFFKNVFWGNLDPSLAFEIAVIAGTTIATGLGAYCVPWTMRRTEQRAMDGKFSNVYSAEIAARGYHSLHIEADSIDGALMALSTAAADVDSDHPPVESAASILLTRLDEGTSSNSVFPRSSLIAMMGGLGLSNSASSASAPYYSNSNRRSFIASNGSISSSSAGPRPSMTNRLIDSFLNVSSFLQRNSDVESNPAAAAATPGGGGGVASPSIPSYSLPAVPTPVAGSKSGKKSRKSAVEFSISDIKDDEQSQQNQSGKKPKNKEQTIPMSFTSSHFSMTPSRTPAAPSSSPPLSVMQKFIQHRREKLDARITNSHINVDLDALREILACASLKFGADPFLILAQAIHAELTFKDKDAAIKLLQGLARVAATSNTGGVFSSSIPFDLEVIVQRFMSTVSGEGGSSDVISQLELARDLKLARQSHMRSLEALQTLTEVLSKSHEVSMPLIENSLRELDRWERVASQGYTRLMYKSPNNTRVLRSFAAFMADVKHNSGEADNLLRRADEIEESTSRVSNDHILGSRDSHNNNSNGMVHSASSFALPVHRTSSRNSSSSSSNGHKKSHRSSDNGPIDVVGQDGDSDSAAASQSSVDVIEFDDAADMADLAQSQGLSSQSSPSHRAHHHQQQQQQRENEGEGEGEQEQEQEHFYLQLPDGSIVETTAEIFQQLQEEEAVSAKRSSSSSGSSAASSSGEEHNNQNGSSPSPQAASVADVATKGQQEQQQQSQSSSAALLSASAIIARRVSFAAADASGSSSNQDDGSEVSSGGGALPRLSREALDTFNNSSLERKNSRSQMVAAAVTPTTPRTLAQGRRITPPPSLDPLEANSVSSVSSVHIIDGVDAVPETPLSPASLARANKEESLGSASKKKEMHKRSGSSMSSGSGEDDAESKSGSSRSSYSSVNGKLVKLRNLLEQRKEKTDSAPILRHLQLSLRAILFLTLGLSCAALVQLLVDFETLKSFFDEYIYMSALRSPLVLIIWHHVKNIVSLSTVNAYNMALAPQFASMIADSRLKIETNAEMFMHLQRDGWQYVRSLGVSDAHYRLYTEALLPTVVNEVPPESPLIGTYDDYTFRTAPNTTNYLSLLAMGQNYATAAENILLRNETKAGNMSTFFILSNADTLASATDRSVEYFLRDSVAKAVSIQTTQSLFLAFAALLYVCFGVFLFVYVLPKIKRYQISSFETLVTIPSPVFRYLSQSTTRALENERDDDDEAALLPSESAVDLKAHQMEHLSLTQMAGPPRNLRHDNVSLFKSAVNRKLLGLLILLWACFIVYFAIGLISSKSSKVASQDLFWPMRSQLVLTNAYVHEVSYCSTQAWCDFAWGRLYTARQELLHMLQVYLYSGDGFEGILGRYTDIDDLLNKCPNPPCFIGSSGLRHNGYISAIHTYSDYVDRILHVQSLLSIVINSPFITIVEEMFDPLYQMTDDLMQHVLVHSDTNFTHYTLGFTLIFASSVLLLIWVYSLVRRKVIAEIGLELHRINLCFLLLPHDVISAHPQVRDFLLLRLKEIESVAT